MERVSMYTADELAALKNVSTKCVIALCRKKAVGYYSKLRGRYLIPKEYASLFEKPKERKPYSKKSKEEERDD